MITEIISKDKFNKLLDDNKLIIVDFYAEWCRPCINLTPYLEKLAQDYKGKCNFYKINVDNNNTKDIIEKFEIKNLPSVCFIKDKICFQKIEGAQNNLIVETLKKYAK